MNRLFARMIANWGVNIATAFVALRTNLMRSILTTLGVMIGVFAVILAVAVGEGAKVSVAESISSLGSNMALIFPQPDDGGDGPRRSRDRGRLTERDARLIARQVPGVTAVAPQLRASIQLVAAGRSASTGAVGVDPGYATVSNLSAEYGRFISEADVRTGARVIVLGPSVVDKLFGDLDPLGQMVRVNRAPFTVVGVLESKGSSFGNDNDDIALVPLSTARQRFEGIALPGPDDLHMLFVGFDEGTDVGEGKRAIIRTLRTRYRVQPDGTSPFTVRTTEEFSQETGQITSVVQGILVAIASISLLVGGIGIMNIMLVSVTERTREIGLRMALGARRADIRNQFLVEAAVLCMIGGTLGLGLAIAAARVFENFANFPAPIGFGTSLFAIAFSGLIGILFGGYPAIRASRLSPIEALRSE
jgi:putative ABC transport system permease protein